MDNLDYSTEHFDVTFTKSQRHKTYQGEIRRKFGGLLAIVTLDGEGVYKRGNWTLSGKDIFYDKTRDVDVTLSMNDTCCFSIEELEELVTTIKNLKFKIGVITERDKKEQEEKAKKRAEALAKLSDEDKQALGLK